MKFTNPRTALAAALLSAFAPTTRAQTQPTETIVITAERVRQSSFEGNSRAHFSAPAITGAGGDLNFPSSAATSASHCARCAFCSAVVKLSTGDSSFLSASAVLFRNA